MFNIIDFHPETKADWNLLREYGRDRLRLFRLDAFDTYIEVLDFGASFWRFFHGGLQIVLSYANPFAYLAEGGDYLGSTLTPFAGRLNTRGPAVQEYLDPEMLEQTLLHSGEKGGARRFWELLEHSDDSFTLGYSVGDKEDGFSARRKFSVRYSLIGPGEVEIYLRCEAEDKTIANLGFHPYFNLSKYPDINLHELKVFAKKLYLTDQKMLPLWDSVLKNEGSILDFSSVSRWRRQLQKSLKFSRSSASEAEARIAQESDERKARILSSVYEQGGLDHYFITEDESDAERAAKTEKELKLQLRLTAPDTESVLEVFSDAPGLVIYSSQHCGKACPEETPRPLTDNRLATSYCGLAIEPQMVPDGPNNPDLIDDYIVEPGRPQERRIIYRFTPPEDLRHGPDTANFRIFDDPLA